MASPPRCRYHATYSSLPNNTVPTHRESRLRDEVVDGLEDVACVHVVVVGVAVASVARLHVHQHRLHRQRGNLKEHIVMP